MKPRAIELYLCGPPPYVALMEDGTYRWVTPGLYLMLDGPSDEWVQSHLYKRKGDGFVLWQAEDVLLETLNDHIDLVK